jgi:cysteinyl-tRNA synthetase
MHSNMLTVNGQIMSKSLGNSFLPAELFAGNHPLLDQAYSPMTVRFFMLQSQYRSTLDFSNDALKAAQKAFRRLLNGYKVSKTLVFKPNDEAVIDEKKSTEIKKAIEGFYEALNDDLNTAVAIAHMFTLLKYVNMIYMNQLMPAALGQEVFEELISKFGIFFTNILGLKEEASQNEEVVLLGMLELYKEYKTNQQYDKVDQIRNYFKSNAMVIKDLKHRIDWAWEE